MWHAMWAHFALQCVAVVGLANAQFGATDCRTPLGASGRCTSRDQCRLSAPDVASIVGNTACNTQAHSSSRLICCPKKQLHESITMLNITSLLSEPNVLPRSSRLPDSDPLSSATDSSTLPTGSSSYSVPNESPESTSATLSSSFIPVTSASPSRPISKRNSSHVIPKLVPGVAPVGGQVSRQSHPNLRLLPTDTCGQSEGAVRGGKRRGVAYAFGGVEASLVELPWMALLEYRHKTNGRRRFACGGVLINRRYVLTAAHCTNSANLDGYKLVGVRLGEHNTNTGQDCDVIDGKPRCVDPAQDYGIDEEVVYPEYSFGDRNKYHDIALLRLNTSVARYSETIRPICLPIDPDVSEKNYTGEHLTVAGWGRTELSFASPVKLKLRLKVVDAAVACAAAYLPLVVIDADTQMCAGGQRESDACSGDSGGPLVSEDLLSRDSKRRHHVTGIVSFGPTCSLSPQPDVKWRPGVYTRVAAYSSWILDQLRP